MRARKGYPVAVYRMYRVDGVLLYIGQSGAPARRIEQHVVGGDWPLAVVRIAVEWHPTREIAVLAEARAIAAERPLHNVAHNPAVRRKRPPQTGGKVLSAWMAQHGISVAQFGGMTEIPVPKLERLLRCELHATRHIPYQIHQATDGEVPWSVWSKPPPNPQPDAVQVTQLMGQEGAA